MRSNAPIRYSVFDDNRFAGYIYRKGNLWHIWGRGNEKGNLKQLNVIYDLIESKKC